PRIYNGTVDLGAYERQATPTVTWATPADIVYGTALGDAQLNATADGPGTFVYSQPFGAVLGAGTYPLSVAVTPADTAHYSSVILTVPLTVLKATPTLTWDTPPDVAIDPNTLEVWVPLQPIFDATANVPGTFRYPFLDGFFPRPPVVYPFDPGSYTFSVTFTPTDTANYTTATASVPFTVNTAAPTVTWATPADIVYAEVGPKEFGDN